MWEKMRHCIEISNCPTPNQCVRVTIKCVRVKIKSMNSYVLLHNSSKTRPFACMQHVEVGESPERLTVYSSIIFGFHRNDPLFDNGQGCPTYDHFNCEKKVTPSRKYMRQWRHSFYDVILSSVDNNITKWT